MRARAPDAGGNKAPWDAKALGSDESSSDDENYTDDSDAEEEPQEACDESFTTALHRLKLDAVGVSSPTTARVRQAEFKRLIKCNSKYTGKISRKRSQPSQELQRRANERQETRRKAAAEAETFRLPPLQPLMAMQSVAAASRGPAPPSAASGINDDCMARTARQLHARRMLAMHNNRTSHTGVTCAQPIAMLPASARGRRRRRGAKQPAVRARTVPSNSRTHIAALPMTDYCPPGPSPSPSKLCRMSGVTVAGMLARVAKRRPEMSAQPLVIFAAEGSVLDNC
eukprot:COSAG05_NODE_4725_length_1396_cov_1.348497_1_plen_283_part_10